MCDFSLPLPPPLIPTLSSQKISVLILNAGVSQRSTFLETPLKTFRSIFSVNLFSSVELLHGLASTSLNIVGGRSQIIYISSVQAQIPLPSRSAYSASKAAATSLCSSLRAEFADFADVCCVEPGYVDTDLSRNAVTKDGRYGKKDETTKNGIKPDLLASKIIIAVNEGRTVVTDGQGLKVRAALWLGFLWRGGLERVMRRRFEKA